MTSGTHVVVVLDQRGHWARRTRPVPHPHRRGRLPPEAGPPDPDPARLLRARPSRRRGLPLLSATAYDQARADFRQEATA